MNAVDKFGLPRYLDDGLLLRWATVDDAESLAAFNTEMHSDDPANPEEWLGMWTKALMSGNHPTTSAGDFTVVVDERNDNRIISSLVLISQTWRYEDVSFGVGRPELVATHPDYRRRGLVRAQMDLIHELSASRGEMVTAITGIPWYYRQFGYEMAVNLGGSRQYFWHRPQNKAKPDLDAYRWRQPEETDIPTLELLYTIHCQRSLMATVRDESVWRYEISRDKDEESDFVNLRLIEDPSGSVVGYVEFTEWRSVPVINELGVMEGHSWRAIILWLVERLRQWVDERSEERKEPLTHLSFHLGVEHPAYDALGSQLERQMPPYAWFIRVPDLPGFLQHIRPVLERRLASSVMAGYTGPLSVNQYRTNFTMQWKSGRLANIDPYRPMNVEDGDGRFPDLTFLQLLFGYRSMDELEYARVDCNTKGAEARILFDALFPKQPSAIIPVA